MNALSDAVVTVAQSLGRFSPREANAVAFTSLLICGITVVGSAMVLPQLSVLQSDRRAAMRGSTYWIAASGLAAIWWAVAKLKLLPHGLDGRLLLAAALLSLVLMSGVLTMWIVDVVCRRSSRWSENSLLAAMLVAPAMVLLLQGAASFRVDLRTVALWFASGLLGQAVCTLWAIIWEPDLRRHHDSPDLGVKRCHYETWQRLHNRTG